MGMSACDIGVFVFLFTQRWSEKKSSFSASEIFKKLDPISGMVPEELRTNYSAKSVGNSLAKLVTLGFVTECKNIRENRTGGRPAKTLYETVPSAKIKEGVIKNLDQYKQKIIHVVSPFEHIEEGISLKEGN